MVLSLRLMLLNNIYQLYVLSFNEVECLFLNVLEVVSSIVSYEPIVNEQCYSSLSS